MNLYLDIIDDALTLLHAHGIAPTIERGKHVKLRWRNDAGRPFLLVVSRTPSTVFARRKSLSVLRRLLRGTA